MSHNLEKVALHTLGCKLNFSESSTIGRDFQQKGFSIVKGFENADIHVINTCSVTDKADKKAKRIIKKIIQTSYNPYITVVGCYAQLKPDEIYNIKGVNLVIGDEQKLNVVNHVLNNFKDFNSKLIHSPISESTDFKSSFSMNDRVRSYLKIQDGCDYPCTYCTIPKARGKSRSDKIDNVIKNIKTLEKNNISEIVLTGVNIGDFGRLSKTENFFNLINKINVSTSIKRYRISSIEPNLLTNEIIDFVKNSNCFLPHFHIPLQSGNNKILSNMKRKYTTEFYAKKIKLIRDSIPNACIGADIIVGFPGESETDFLKTCEFIENIKIDYLHVFSYSNRQNAKAINFTDQVPRNLKLDRSRILQKQSEKMRLKFYKNNLNNVKKVLFESIYENDYIVGFTDNYVRVYCKGTKEMINKIYNVKLLFLSEDKVLGEII